MGSKTKWVVLLIAILFGSYLAKPIFQRHTELFKSRTPDEAHEALEALEAIQALEAIEELKDKCFITRQGWWSYEFCSHKKLRQFHVENNGQVVQEFVLGEYDAEVTAAHERNFVDTLTGWKDPSRRYHAHIYTNGTKCDLTNEIRETEVRFECLEPSEMFIRVAELSACKYALTIRCEKDVPIEDYWNY